MKLSILFTICLLLFAGFAEAQSFEKMLQEPRAKSTMRPNACGYGACTFDSDCCSDTCNQMTNQCGQEGSFCGYGSCTFDSDCCSGTCNQMSNQCGQEGSFCGYGACTFDSDCCSGACNQMNNQCTDPD